VESAVVIARTLGLSELIIGLTVVAIGTSSPEIATSVIAALRAKPISPWAMPWAATSQHSGGVGVAAIVASGGVTVAPSALAFDIPVMIG